MKKKLKKGEAEKALRTGVVPPRTEIQEAVDSVLLTATTVPEFSTALEKLGIVYAEKTDDAGKIVGITFRLGEAKFGGSKLGDQYRHPAILQKLESNRNGTPIKDGTRSGLAPIQGLAEKNRGTRKGGRGNEAGNRPGSQNHPRPAESSGSYPPSPAEEIQLARLTTKNRIVCVSVVPLIPSRRGYRDHIGVDGRVWLYHKATNQRAGLAFRQNGDEKVLEVHRDVTNLTDQDAEALVRLAVESGITGPLKIEGDPSFISKITAAARRLNVPVHGDPAPAAPALPDPDQPTPGLGRRMR